MRSVKVWDLFVRSFHWGLAALVLGAFLTSEEHGGGMMGVHVRIGLAILALVLARILYGLVGPTPARFTSFVRGPREVLAHARGMLRGRPALHLSHNPLGGAMVVALLAALLGLAMTGVLAHAGLRSGGATTGLLPPRTARGAKEIHEALFPLLLGLLGAHIAGVLVSSLLERQNLVKSMITGWKRMPDAHPAAPGAARRLTVASAAASIVVGSATAAGAAFLGGIPARTRAAGPPGTELVGRHLVGHHEGRRHEERTAHERDERHRRGHGRQGSMPASTAEQALYEKECGACHLAYPPAFLPATSWAYILGGLERHHGQDVQLDPEARTVLERWLAERAGEPRREEWAGTTGGAPPRITELAWFRRKHAHAVRAGARPPSLSSCARCHPGAARWDFDEDRVKIPDG